MDKDIEQAKKDYKELKDRMKGKRIDYKKLEEELLEMMGDPPTEKERALIQKWLRGKNDKIYKTGIGKSRERAIHKR